MIEETRLSESMKTRARFLLAPYRSGTTLLRFCLDSHPDLAVPPESDFLLPFCEILDSHDSMRGFRDLGYSEDQVASRIAAFSRQFHDTYAAGQQAGAGWLDKSPLYAESPEVLARVFRDAKYLILHRHPLDQVHSFTRGGRFSHPALRDPSLSGLGLIEAGSEYWANVTAGLMTFSEHHDECTFTLRYEDLCAEPERTLSSVISYLGLEWNDSVLRYDRYPHDVGREAGRVSGTKGFSISAGKWRSWPTAWRDRAWAIVGPRAKRLGYGLE